MTVSLIQSLKFAHCHPSVTEPKSAQFSHEWEATVTAGKPRNLADFPWQVSEFRKVVCGILPNFLRKMVDPGYEKIESCTNGQFSWQSLLVKEV